jgi:pseudomonalisin
VIPLSRRRAVAAAGVLGLLVTGGAAAAATSRPAVTHRVPSYLLGLSGATRLGAADPRETLHLSVSLNRPDPAGEARLLEQVDDPASPLYRHFLTPAEFAQRFGVTPSATAATRRWLSRSGLTVDSTSPTGDFLTVSGTVAAVQKAFAVHENRYLSQGRHFIANDAPPLVPTALPIGAVSGLDTVRSFVPTGKPATRGSGSFAGTLTPTDLWGLYDLPKDNLGQGQTAGVFGEGEPDTVVQNLRYFEKAQDLPKVPVRVVTTEGGGFQDYGDNAGNIEWYLDSQAITGMAPDLARLDLYFAKTLFDHDIFASFKKWADDPNGPLQMNASFGECEANPSNPATGPLAQIPYGTEVGDELEAIGEPVLQQANLEGRTLFASTGDTGSGCPEVVVPVLGAGNGVAIQPIPIVNYPAASPHVVAVGGTVLTTDGTDHAKRTNEQSWLFTGGGASHFIAEPSYQRAIPQITQPCVAHADGQLYAGAPPTCRGIPDVSTLSGNITGNGYVIDSDGAPSSEGGTSLSSPLMVGMWSRIQAAAPTAKGLGFANPVFYRLGANPTEYARDFHDITQAEHGAPGNGTYLDGKGWDYVSGLGSPDVSRIMRDVLGRTRARVQRHVVEAGVTAECLAAFRSPSKNATDPLDSTGEEASVDIATGSLKLSTNGRSIVATLRGSGLSPTPPPDATGGESFHVLWQYDDQVWFAAAEVGSTGKVTYRSGHASDNGYTDLGGSKATGTFADGTLTVSVPRSEVGSPPLGASLRYPFAVASVSVGEGVTLGLTVDTASQPTSGPSTSVGQALVLGSACRKR